LVDFRIKFCNTFGFNLEIMNLFVWNGDESCACWGWLGMAVYVTICRRAMYCVMLIELWHHSIVGQKCIALTIISKINISLILIRALQNKVNWNCRSGLIVSQQHGGSKSRAVGNKFAAFRDPIDPFQCQQDERNCVIINTFLSLSERSQCKHLNDCGKLQEERRCTYDVTFRCGRATTVAVEKQ